MSRVPSRPIAYLGVVITLWLSIFVSSQGSSEKWGKKHHHKTTISDEKGEGVLHPTNLLLIMFDDLRPELSIYGRDNVITPNFERLAKKSVVFDHAFSQIAVCNPSRDSMLTGLRPDTVGSSTSASNPNPNPNQWQTNQISRGLSSVSCLFFQGLMVFNRHFDLTSFSRSS